jgi:hypothetical protein
MLPPGDSNWQLISPHFYGCDWIYANRCVNYAKKQFYGIGPGVNLKKLFWFQLTNTFCKVDHFINVTTIFLSNEEI